MKYVGFVCALKRFSMLPRSGVAIRAIHVLNRAYWFVVRPVTFGVRAAVFDESGRLVLVIHTYRSGYYFPGGGVKRGEAKEAAIVRELREEIGLRAWSSITHFGTYASNREYKRDTVDLFVVRGAVLAPEADTEIRSVHFFRPNNIPAETSPATARRLAEILSGQQEATTW